MWTVGPAWRPVMYYDKYVGPYCLAEMYAGRVACCPMVRHGEYADGTNRQTDGR